VCDICGQVSKTRHAFAMHKKRKHKVNLANEPLPDTPRQIKKKEEAEALAAASAAEAAITAAAAAAVDQNATIATVEQVIIQPQ